jgi:hypothetical protein
MKGKPLALPKYLPAPVITSFVCFNIWSYLILLQAIIPSVTFLLLFQVSLPRIGTMVNPEKTTQ